MDNFIPTKKITSKKNILIFIALAVVAIAGLYYFAFPKIGRFFPKCPFFLLTHLYCPGCGSQRCIAALLHGHILAALHQNILTVIALPVIFYRVYLIICGRTIQNTIFATRAMPWIVLASVMFFAILRNIPVVPFKWLAPY